MSIVNPPLVPVGLRDLVKSFTKDLLSKQPPNIPEYAVEYFEKMLPQNSYKVKEYELHGYGESLTKTRKLNQYPLSAVFAIFPKPLTQIIKDFIKALLRENPNNLIEFAIKYFRELKQQDEIEQVDYSTYVNYINSKKPLTLGSTVRCTCGRILTNVPNIKSISNTEEPFKATLDKQNNNENTPEEKTSPDNKDNEDPFGNRLKAVLILQRLYRRSIKLRVEKDKQVVIDKSINYSNAILATTVAKPTEINVETTGEPFDDEVTKDNTGGTEQVNHNPDQELQDVQKNDMVSHATVIASEVAQDNSLDELNFHDDGQEIPIQTEEQVQNEKLPLEEQEQKAELDVEDLTNQDDESKNRGESDVQQHQIKDEREKPHIEEKECKEASCSENLNIIENHDSEDHKQDGKTTSDQVIVKEDTILIAQQDDEKNVTENKENIAIQPEEQETESQNIESDMQASAEEYRHSKEEEKLLSINYSGSKSLEKVDEPIIEQAESATAEPRENRQNMDNDIGESTNAKEILLKEEEDSAKTSGDGDLKLSKDGGQQKTEVGKILNAIANKEDINHASVEHNELENETHLGVNKLMTIEAPGSEEIIKENIEPDEQEHEDYKKVKTTDTSNQQEAQPQEEVNYRRVEAKNSKHTDEVKEQNIEIMETEATVENEASIKSDLKEEDISSQTIENDVIETGHVVRKREEQLRPDSNLDLMALPEVNTGITELTEKNNPAVNEEDNKIKSENTEFDVNESVNEDPKRNVADLGSNQSELMERSETGNTVEILKKIDQEETAKDGDDIEKDVVKSSFNNGKCEEEKGITNRQNPGEVSEKYKISNQELEEQPPDHLNVANNLQLFQDDIHMEKEVHNEKINENDADKTKNLKEFDENVSERELEKIDLKPQIERSSLTTELEGNKDTYLEEKGVELCTEVKDEVKTYIESMNNEKLNAKSSFDVEEEKSYSKQSIHTAKEENNKEKLKEVPMVNDAASYHTPGMQEKENMMSTNKHEETRNESIEAIKENDNNPIRESAMHDSILENESFPTDVEQIIENSNKIESREENKCNGELTPKSSSNELLIQDEHNKDNSKEVDLKKEIDKTKSNDSIEYVDTCKEVVESSENLNNNNKTQIIATSNNVENNKVQADLHNLKNNNAKTEKTKQTNASDMEEDSAHQLQKNSEEFYKEEQPNSPSTQSLTDKERLSSAQEQKNIKSIKLEPPINRSLDRTNSGGNGKSKDENIDETKNSINEKESLEVLHVSGSNGNAEMSNHENLQETGGIRNKFNKKGKAGDQNIEAKKENEKPQADVISLEKSKEISLENLNKPHTISFDSKETETNEINKTENTSFKSESEVDADNYVINLKETKDVDTSNSQATFEAKSISANSSSSTDKNIENEEEQVMEIKDYHDCDKKIIEKTFSESKSDTFIKELNDSEPQKQFSKIISDEAIKAEPTDNNSTLQKADDNLAGKNSNINAAINKILSEAKNFIGISSDLGMKNKTDVVEPEIKKTVDKRVESTDESFENKTTPENDNRIESNISTTPAVDYKDKVVTSRLNNIEHERNNDNEPDEQPEEINKLKSHAGSVIANQETKVKPDNESLDNEQKEKINNLAEEADQIKKIQTSVSSLRTSTDSTSEVENKVGDSDDIVTTNEIGIKDEKNLITKENVGNSNENIEMLKKTENIEIKTKENNITPEIQKSKLEIIEGAEMENSNENDNNEKNTPSTEEISTELKEMINLMSNVDTNPSEKSVEQRINKDFFYTVGDLQLSEKPERSLDVILESPPTNETEMNDDLTDHTEIVITERFIPTDQLYDIMEENSSSTDLSKESNASIDLIVNSNDVNIPYTELNNLNKNSDDKQKALGKEKTHLNEEEGQQDDLVNFNKLNSLETTEDISVGSESDKIPTHLQHLGESSVTEIKDRNVTEKFEVDSETKTQNTDKAQNGNETLKKTKSTLSKTSDSSSKDDDTVQIGKLYSTEEESDQSSTTNVVSVSEDHGTTISKQTDKMLNSTKKNASISNIDEDVIIGNNPDMPIAPQMENIIKIEKSLENTDEDDVLAELKNIQPRQSRGLLRSNTDSVMTQPPDTEAFIEALQNKESVDISDDEKSDLDKIYSLEGDIQDKIRENIYACSLSESNSDSFDVVMQQLENAGPIAASDDKNIDTALVDATGTSTDSESTIVSAVTKIQANTRGYLTRKRLRRESHGNKSSAADEQKASFGNAAISESLEYLVKDAAAKKIQKFMRTFRLFRQHKEEDLDDDEVIIRKTVISTTSSSDHSLAARRMTLQRGDALRNDSLPDDDSSSSGSPKQFTDGKAAKLSVSARSYVNTSVDRRLMWQLIRRNSMPVQIDSDVFRIMPKHLKKRVSSVEIKKKQSTNFMKK